jgi:hypothetical protein
MSEFNIAVSIISSLVSLLFLWLLLFWFYRDYRVDALRQEMFALRDEMFDWAGKSGVPYDHTAYGMLRSAMNGFIRFGHRLTIFQVFLMYVLGRKGDAEAHVNARAGEFGERWNAEISNLDDDKKAQLLRYREKMHFIVINHLAWTPVAMVTIVLPLVAWTMLRYCFDSLTNWFRRPIDRMDAAAVAVGQ